MALAGLWENWHPPAGEWMRLSTSSWREGHDTFEAATKATAAHQ